MNAKKTVTQMAHKADIQINGDRPGDIQVNNEGFYSRVLRDGDLGLGESYMERWWDSDDLGLSLDKVVRAKIKHAMPSNLRTTMFNLSYKIFNMQLRRHGRHLAKVHYNLSTKLYERMLGTSMAYTCGYWQNAKDLDAAQYAKNDLICRKLQLNKDDHLLDIGCGWGGFARQAAENYGCKVTGISIAEEQIKYAKKYCKGLPINLHLCDYRDISKVFGKQAFTKVSAIGMFEHVGARNYRTFFKTAYDALVDRGLFVLHTLGGHETNHEPLNLWMNKYIFPGAMLASIKQIGEAFDRLFVLEDAQNIGYHYGKTLQAWYERFNDYWNDKAMHDDRPTIDNSRDKFYRMWCFYLLSCKASLENRQDSVWQFVLAKGGMPTGYLAPR
ncbi:MAG: cyclopropane fatty acyl phospholipid synthase [Pseudomonadota bacterium]